MVRVYECESNIESWQIMEMNEKAKKLMMTI